jgi:hypothetical protein
MKLTEVLQQTKDVEDILSFEEVGKMIRAIKPLCDPISKYVTKSVVYIGSSPTHRNRFKVYDELTITIHDIWNEEKTAQIDETPRLESVLRELDKLGIKYINNGQWIMIRVFPDVHLGSFNTSDDPKVWRKKQERAEYLRKVRRVEKKLDRK